jgi:hypothetical protein
MFNLQYSKDLSCRNFSFEKYPASGWLIERDTGHFVSQNSGMTKP